jgi:hypothetical protein
MTIHPHSHEPLQSTALAPPPPHWTSVFYIMSPEGIRSWRIDRGLKAIALAKRFASLGRRALVDLS